MITTYTVTIKKNCWITELDRTEQMRVSFDFNYYGDVESFIGSLVKGSDIVDIELRKREVSE